MSGEQGLDKTDIPSDIKARLGDTTANLKKGAEDLGSKAKKSVQIANDAIRDKVQLTKEQAKNWNGERDESKERNGDRSEGRNREQETGNDETKENVEQNVISDNDRVDRSKKEVEVETSEPEEIESNNLDGEAKAYEVNPDEALNPAEKRAEEEMQPNGGA